MKSEGKIFFCYVLLSYDPGDHPSNIGGAPSSLASQMSKPDSWKGWVGWEMGDPFVVFFLKVLKFCCLCCRLKDVIYSAEHASLKTRGSHTRQLIPHRLRSPTDWIKTRLLYTTKNHHHQQQQHHYDALDY